MQAPTSIIMSQTNLTLCVASLSHICPSPLSVCHGGTLYMYFRNPQNRQNHQLRWFSVCSGPILDTLLAHWACWAPAPRVKSPRHGTFHHPNHARLTPIGIARTATPSPLSLPSSVFPPLESHPFVLSIPLKVTKTV